jgi:hypothetical protein
MSFPNDRTYSFDANNCSSRTTPRPTPRAGYLQRAAPTASRPRRQPGHVAGAAGAHRRDGDLRRHRDHSLGKGASRDGVNMKDSVIGRYELSFCTQLAGVLYEYAKIYIAESGTAPSITTVAFIAVQPEG